MNVREFRLVLTERIRIAQETQDEWEDGIRNCWNKEIEYLSAEMDETIEFLDSQCTADEFGWISEVCCEVAEKTQSIEFIEALWRLVQKYPKESEQYNVAFFIRCAEATISYYCRKR